MTKQEVFKRFEILHKLAGEKRFKKILNSIDLEKTTESNVYKYIVNSKNPFEPNIFEDRLKTFGDLNKYFEMFMETIKQAKKINLI